MRSLSIVMLTLLAACAAPVQQVPVVPGPEPQQAAPAFDPVGVYDFTTDVQGTSIRGVLTIRRVEDGLAGTIATDVTGEIPLQQVTVEGRRAELRASTGEGHMLMRVDFLEEGRLSGGWELSSGLSGAVTGRRRPAQ